MHVTRSARIAIGAAAGVAGVYFVHRALNSRSTSSAHVAHNRAAVTEHDSPAAAGPGIAPLRADDTVTGRLANAATVTTEHAKAAIDDVKKGASEVAHVVKAHAHMAGRDMSHTGSEVADALTGDLRTVKVRDTPPTVRTDVPDNVRPAAGMAGGGTSAASAPRPTSDESYARAMRYATPTASTITPSYSDRAKMAGAVVGDHAEAAAADAKTAGSELRGINHAHSELAKRDIKTAGGEVKQALRGERLPGGAAVRDTPDLLRETPRDRVRPEATSSTAADRATREAPTVTERLREAKDVIAAHTAAAVDDVKQWGHEAGEVVRGHGAMARADVSNAGSEVGDARRGFAVKPAPVRTPPMTTASSTAPFKAESRMTDGAAESTTAEGANVGGWNARPGSPGYIGGAPIEPAARSPDYHPDGYLGKAHNPTSIASASKMDGVSE